MPTKLPAPEREPRYDDPNIERLVYHYDHEEQTEVEWVPGVGWLPSSTIDFGWCDLEEFEEEALHAIRSFLWQTNLSNQDEHLIAFGYAIAMNEKKEK